MATMVVAWGTAGGWPADVPVANGAYWGSSSGRSRWRCSVNDDVALAATLLAVVSCTGALLQRGDSAAVRYLRPPCPVRVGGAAGLLSALLHERPDELFRIGFQDAVDLVQEIVNTLRRCGRLSLGRCRRRGDLFLDLAVAWLRLL